MTSYTDRASEADALVKAVVAVLEEVPANRREAVLADVCKDEHVHRALTRHVEKSFKKQPSFSVSKAALAHHSNTFSRKTQGGLPSSISKRIAKGR